MWRISISARSKSYRSTARPSSYDKRLKLHNSTGGYKEHKIPRRGHVWPGERTIMFNMNQPLTDTDIDPYKSACVNRCRMCGVPISKFN